MVLTSLLSVQNIESSLASHCTIDPKCPKIPDPKIPPLLLTLSTFCLDGLDEPIRFFAIFYAYVCILYSNKIIYIKLAYPNVSRIPTHESGIRPCMMTLNILRVGCQGLGWNSRSRSHSRILPTHRSFQIAWTMPE